MMSEACLTRQVCPLLLMHSACYDIPTHISRQTRISMPRQAALYGCPAMRCNSMTAATQVQVLRRAGASNDPAPLRPQAILPAAKAPPPVQQHSTGPDAPAASSLLEWCADLGFPVNAAHVGMCAFQLVVQPLSRANRYHVGHALQALAPF